MKKILSVITIIALLPIQTSFAADGPVWFATDLNFLKTDNSLSHAFGLDTLRDPDGEAFLEPNSGSGGFFGGVSNAIQNPVQKVKNKVVNFLFPEKMTPLLPNTQYNNQMHWAEPYMNYLLQRGIVRISRGIPDFDQVVQRKELAAFSAALRYYVERHSFISREEPVLPILSDVSNDDPHYYAYVKAVHDGLIYVPNGQKLGNTAISATLNPNANTFRIQALQSIVRALDLKIPEEKKESKYSDIPTDSWMEPYVQAAVLYDVLPTKCDNVCDMHPMAPITRGELYYMATQALSHF